MNNIPSSTAKFSESAMPHTDDRSILTGETMKDGELDYKKLALESRQSILDGATGAPFRQGVQLILKALTVRPEIADVTFQDDLFEKLRGVAGSVFADPVTRSEGIEIMARIDPFYTKLFLSGMMFEESNGRFAVQELLKLTEGEGGATVLIPKQAVIQLLQGNLNKLINEFSSLDGDEIKQGRIRTGLLNQAAYMSASQSAEGREFLEDLLGCRDFDLQKQLLERLGKMGSAAVQSLYVIGEHRNRVSTRFNSDDASELAAVALTAMTEIAEDYSKLPRKTKVTVVSAPVRQELLRWLNENQLPNLALLLG